MNNAEKLKNNKVLKVLWGKINKNDWDESVLLEGETDLKNSDILKYAKENKEFKKFKYFRIQIVDLTKKPNFIKTIK